MLQDKGLLFDNNGNILGSAGYTALSKGYFPPERRRKPVDLFGSGTGFTLQSTDVSNVAAGPSGNILISPDSRLIIPTHYLESSRNKALSDLKDQKVNAAQAIAEGKQTLGLAGDIARNALEAYRNLRRGNLNALSKNVSSAWLQYQYGIMPTIGDINGAAEKIAQGMASGTTFSRSKSAYSLQSQHSANVSGVLVSTTESIILQYRHLSRFMVTSSTLKEATSLGFTNPLYLAWEFVPYSFVFDWYLGIGTYLSSLDALYGLADLQTIEGTSILHSTSSRTPYGTASSLIEYKARSAPSGSNLRPSMAGVLPTSSLIDAFKEHIGNAVALLNNFRRS